MSGIIIAHGGRYIPAEMVGTTNQARLPGDGYAPRSWKSAKQARRYARRLFGAGNLDMRKYQVKVTRGQSLQCGHIVTVEPLLSEKPE